MDDLLGQLQHWYAAQCDGDWEHGSGIEIASLDNPGWHVRVDLTGTALAGRGFEAVRLGLDDPASTDWHSLSVEDGRFVGVGDPSKLAFIVRAFLDWAGCHGL